MSPPVTVLMQRRSDRMPKDGKPAKFIQRGDQLVDRRARWLVLERRDKIGWQAPLSKHSGMLGANTLSLKANRDDRRSSPATQIQTRHQLVPMGRPSAELGEAQPA